MKKILFLSLCIALLLGVALAFSLTASATPDFTPKVSVSLTQSITFNIYLPATEKIDGVEIDGCAVDMSKIQANDGYYQIKIPLTAKNALEEIKMKVTLDLDGTHRVGSFTYSIPDYASTLISENSDNSVKTLAKALLAYLDSASVYFGGVSNTEVAEIIGSYEGTFAPDAVASTTPALSGATFVLGDMPSVRFYPDSAHLNSSFSFSNKHGALTAVSGEDENGFFFEVKLYAYALKDKISYTVDSLYGEYNLSSYCSFVENEYNKPDKAKLLDLSKKLYIYSVCANQYRNEVICDHSFTSEIKKEATATEEGIMLYTCGKCGNTYEERIPTTLKILAIGNSFSEDSFKHMYIVAKSAGVENVVLGNMYIGGCSLATHKKNMQGDLGKYKFWISSDTAGGMIVEGESRTAKYGITYENWDYISVQQASTDSGKPDTYSDLVDIIDYINSNKTSDAKILWHMTWAYQQDSDHSGFSKYGNDQMTMYNAILDAVKTKVLTNSDIYGVIPSGTAVQNLRTSTLGDTLTRDGYHLSLGIGRYTAALTWIAYITGCDVDKITATPSEYPEVATSLDYIKDAVKKAIAKPYEVTQSAYPPATPPEPTPTPTPTPAPSFDATLLNLTGDDIQYLENNGLDASDYMLLDLEVVYNAYYQSIHSTKYASYLVADSGNNQYMKWWATRIFSKSELVNGSIIRVDSGYKYRPEGWVDMAKNSTRPDVVSQDFIVVDDEWWGDYNYRAFNVGKSNGSSFVQSEFDSYASNINTLDFKIYVPTVKREALTAEDITYLTDNGYDASQYMVLDFDYYLDYYYNSASTNNDFSSLIVGKGQQAGRFIATEIFTKYDLTVGSVIRITESGVRYRPEGWIDLSTRNTSSTRPDNVSTRLVCIDSDWWGNFSYRAFNISLTNSGQISESYSSSLRIYIKIA